MTAAEIKEYLGMCVELEKEIYTQNRTISSLDKQIQNLGYYKRFAKPQKPKMQYIDNNGAGSAGYWGRILLILGCSSIAVAFLFQSDFFLECGILSAIIGVALFLVSHLLYKDIHRDAEKRYSRQLEEYNDKTNQLSAALQNDAKRVNAERVKKAVLQSSLDTLKAANAKSRKCLQQIYDKNIIFSKYRNYSCVCTLYEYFTSGRCTTLEGHEGAYNILESEIRLNRIITQNDKIIENLKEIKENQWLLYEAIEESNCKVNQLIRNCEQMSNQLNGIQSQGAELNARIANLQTTSDINLYVNACAKRELEYMNRANRIF